MRCAVEAFILAEGLRNCAFARAQFVVCCGVIFLDYIKFRYVFKKPEQMESSLVLGWLSVWAA